MKKKLFLLLFVFVLFSVGLNPSYSTCFLFDGTYVGAAITTGSDGKKVSRPLFIVVANQHIAGFFAPEDQKTHGPTGSSFNLGDLTASNSYTLSLTTDNNILIKSSDGKVNGKAKLSTIESGSASFSGFYNSDVTGDFLPGDFLNVGSDGGAILKFAGSDGKVVHAFGKINDSGKFVQVFPEKGNGPHVTINFDGNSADLEATLDDNSSITTLNKFINASCSSTSSSTSSSGGPSNKPALVANFQDVLNGISSTSTTKIFVGSESEVKNLQDAVRLVKYVLLNLPVADCNNQLSKKIEQLSNAINALRNAAKCGGSCIGALLSLDEDNLVIQYKSTVDETGNGVLDICEQYSQFSGERPISIAPDLKNLLTDINNISKTIRIEAKETFSKPTLNEQKLLFDKLSKLLKSIQASLRLPDSLCSLRIQQVGSVRTSVIDINNNVCVNPVTELVSCKKNIQDLIEDADLIDGLIKLDNNKNGIADVCE